jgi:hypothetical protein
MLLSFLLLGGFLYWLNVKAEPTQPPVVEEGEGEGPALGGTAVEPGALAVTPQQYEGQTVRVENVNVSSPVGPRAFFVDLTPQHPFLVRMDSALVARGMAMPSGRVSLVGTIHVMTDSIIDAWEADTSIRQADRPVVEFASHFLVAQEIRSAAGGDQAPVN